jgi:hypothetical protein
MTGKKIGFGELVQSFGSGLAPPTDLTQHVLIHTPAVAPLALASPEALRPAVTGSLPFQRAVAPHEQSRLPLLKAFGRQS